MKNFFFTDIALYLRIKVCTCMTVIKDSILTFMYMEGSGISSLLMCIQVISEYATKQVTTSRRSYFRVLLTVSQGAWNGSYEVASCTEVISIRQRRVKSRKLISYEKKQFIIYPKSLLNAVNSV